MAGFGPNLDVWWREGRLQDTQLHAHPRPHEPNEHHTSGRGAHSFRGSSRMTNCKEPSGCKSQLSPAPSRRVGNAPDGCSVFIPCDASRCDDAAPSSVGSEGSRAACADSGWSVGTELPSSVSSCAGVGTSCSGVEGGSRRHAVAAVPKPSESTRMAGRILWRGSCSMNSYLGTSLLEEAVLLSFACSVSLPGGGLKR